MHEIMARLLHVSDETEMPHEMRIELDLRNYICGCMAYNIYVHMYV